MRRRFLTLVFLVFACITLQAQQAGRPRQVPTKPGTPCNARDFIAANDTGLWWGCNPLTRLWDPVTESGTPVVGTGTANQVSKFTAAQTLGNSGITDDGTTDTFKLTETAPGAATVALAGTGAGSVTNGAHIVKVTCVTAGGQTTVGTASSTVTVTDNTANGKVAISAIPLCSSIATGRDVYMNTVAAPTVFKLLSNGVIANNTATTLTANDSDATLAASTTAPSTNTAIDARLTIGQSTVTVAKNLTVGGICTGCGITNSAGNNVLMKSNGTNAVASEISDDGVSIGLGFSTFSQAGNGTVLLNQSAGSTAELQLNGSTSILGDADGHGNNITLTVDDAASLITASSSLQVNGNIVVNNGIVPLASSGSQIGSAALNFSSFYVGNAANQSSQISCTACTGNRAVEMPNAGGTVQLVGAANTGSILPVDMSNGVLSTATGTVYASPGTTAGLTNATESAVSFPITRAGTVRNLYVRTGGTAKVNTPATVITIRKNGVDTAVTVTMTQTTSTTSSDTTHSFTVVAGDLITLSFVTTGTAAVSTSIAGVSFEID